MYTMLPFNHMSRTFNNLFDEMERSMFPAQPSGRLPAFRTDIKDQGDHYLLEADLPGFKKDEVNVDLKDGYLTISASKGLDKDQKDKEGKYIRQERYAGTCSRSFYVGDVEPKDISAKYENGILMLTLPKHAKKELPSSNSINIG